MVMGWVGDFLGHLAFGQTGLPLEFSTFRIFKISNFPELPKFSNFQKFSYFQKSSNFLNFQKILKN